MSFPEMVYELVTLYPVPLYVLAVLVVVVFGAREMYSIWKGKGKPE